MTSIKDFLKKGKQRSTEETDLQRALELSKQDQINEQKKLLQQFERLSKKEPIKQIKKRKIIQEKEDDDWFQTISTRPQVKEEKPFEFDLSSIFNNTSDEQEDDVELNKFFKDNASPMVSDAESDCSVIDLCNQHTNQTSTTQPEEDDGYLSPLEGFVNLKDIESNKNYFAQFDPKPTRKKRATTSSKPKTKKKYFYKRSYKKKKK